MPNVLQIMINTKNLIKLIIQSPYYLNSVYNDFQSVSELYDLKVVDNVKIVSTP